MASEKGRPADAPLYGIAAEFRTADDLLDGVRDHKRPPVLVELLFAKAVEPHGGPVAQASP